MRNDDAASFDETGAAAARPGIGETLRATREFRRASIEYVSELLRIEPQFLVALEEERFEAIGPPVFVKGYLKHYCELLGIDPAPLLDELRERLDRNEPPLRARRSAEQASDRSSAPVIGIGAAVAVIALAALAIWRFDLLGGPEPRANASVPADTADTSPQASTSAASSATRADSPSTANAPNATSAVGSTGQAQTAAATAPAQSLGTTVRTQPLELPSQPPADAGGATSGAGDTGDTRATGEVSIEIPIPPSAGAGPEQQTSASSTVQAASATGTGVTGTQRNAPQPSASAPVDAPASAPSAADTTPIAGTAAAPGAERAPLELELRFLEDSWTEVTAAGGERLFYGLARAGAEERIRADGEIRVLLGNADGVVVRVNGAPFAYPAGSRSGDLARFRLSPEN